MEEKKVSQSKLWSNFWVQLTSNLSLCCRMRSLYLRLSWNNPLFFLGGSSGINPAWYRGRDEVFRTQSLSRRVIDCEVCGSAAVSASEARRSELRSFYEGEEEEEAAHRNSPPVLLLYWLPCYQSGWTHFRFLSVFDKVGKWNKRKNKQTNKNKKCHLIVNRKLPFHVMSLPQEVRC